MPTGTITKKVTAGGLTLQSTVTRTEEAVIAQSIALAAGVAGEISSAGVDTLATGHGILDTDTVDVHWTDAAGVQKCRYGISVDTVSTNAITFDDDPAAAGDALPAENYEVVVSVQTPIEIAFDSAQLMLFAAECTQNAHINVLNDDPVSVYALKIAARDVRHWAEGEGIDNPFTGEDDDIIDSIVASNGSTTAATLKIVVMYDSVN
ncbi:hypothetical protein M0R72_13695 [Candidatus Pacearchaeota archaeon]|jgi:hypothetical protein|nr:hypothetical protein [Candidatus Pacearchaeota archaeon]